MTTLNTTSKIRYTGNGATVAFSYPFKIFAASDLQVYLILRSTGVATLQTITTHYTVSINRNSDGGTVTFVTAPASTYDVLIKRVNARTQSTDFPAVSSFPEESVENALDKLAMICAEVDEVLARALKFATTSSFSDVTFPELVADKYIKVTAAGTGLETGTPTVTTTEYPSNFSTGTDAAKPASPSTGDIYYAKDTNKFYKCFVAGTWTTAIVVSEALDFVKGSDVSDSATPDIGAAPNVVDLAGTTPITGFGTVAAGALRWVRFTGARSLTYNATSLILPGAANITTANGDTALLESLGSGNWVCHYYQRASGLPIISGLPKNYMDGGIISNNSGDATNDLDITATVCRSDDDAEDISVIAMTKRIDAAFVAGTNQGFLDASTIGASEDLVYIYAIKNPTTGATDYLASKSATAPTMPSGFTKKRLLGGRRWDGAAWSPFATLGNGRVVDVWYKDVTDADLLVLNGGTATAFTDVDCGDGGAEVVPASAYAVELSAEVRSGSVTDVYLYARRNGDTGSLDSQHRIIKSEPSGSTPRKSLKCSLPVDGDGIFEYALPASCDAYFAVRGYREVR